MSNYNSNANIVRQTQTAINAAGYTPPLTVDGADGPQTRAGIMWFQGQHHLTQDGIIGDQTLAATIAPTPGAAAAAANDPLAGIRATVARLQQMQQGGSAAAASSPLLPVPVNALGSKSLALHLGALQSAVGGSSALAPAISANPSMLAQTPGVVLTAAAPTPSKTIPAVIGTVAGVALGFVLGPPLGKVLGVGIGAVAGLGAGLAYAFVSAPTPAAPAPVVIAGEVSFGFEEDGFDLGEDFVIDEETNEIVAGDMGVASSYGTLRA